MTFWHLHAAINLY